jgi:hypothetical protein
MKYLAFRWVLDGSGFSVADTLNEIKNMWHFGCIVWYVDEEHVDSIKQFSKNKDALAWLDERYERCFQDGEPMHCN